MGMRLASYSGKLAFHVSRFKRVEEKQIRLNKRGDLVHWFVHPMKQAHVESFPGLVYASVYFTTDQYVPNLPQMEFDLQGSQTLMSGTVNLNIMVKGQGGVP